MSDLIRREDAINSLREQICGECKPGVPCDICHTDDLIRAVAEIPPIDAVEAVLCKDCYYYRPYDIFDGKQGRCYKSGRSFMACNGYCSMGVRKEGGEGETI